MTSAFSRTLSDGRAGFPELLEAIESHLDERDVPPGPAAQLMVAFDEIISNVLDYGGGEGRAPSVAVSLRIGGGSVHAEVSDDGQAFDPLAAAAPDTALSLDDREIGGLGIHLVRKLMDDVAYVRDGDRNRLRISKNYALD